MACIQDQGQGSHRNRGRCAQPPAQAPFGRTSRDVRGNADDEADRSASGATWTTCARPIRSGRMARCLERRAGARATKAYEMAAQAAAGKPDAGSAVRHLREAWSAAYSLKADPVRAYSEAVKAVQSAAHAVVEPNNARATLGTMIGQMRGNPQAFHLGLGGRSGKRGEVGGMTAMLCASVGRPDIPTWENGTNAAGDSRAGSDGRASRGHLGGVVRFRGSDQSLNRRSARAFRWSFVPGRRQEAGRAGQACGCGLAVAG